MTPLEALYSLDHWIQVECADRFKIIETALKDSEMEHTLRIRLENINYELVREKEANEKKLKALEIIDIANVDIVELKRSVDVQQYNSNHFSTSIDLVPETFDLLKEVFLND